MSTEKMCRPVTRVAIIVGLAFALCCTLAAGIEPSAAHQPEEAMAAWAGQNFTGASKGYSSNGPAEYVAGVDNGFAGIGNDNIESLRVSSGWEAVLCDHAEATGTCRTYSAGTYTSLADLDNRVSYVCIKREAAVVNDNLGSPCSIYNTSPFDYGLTPVAPMTASQCASQFGFRFDTNAPRANTNSTVYRSKVMILVHNPFIQRANTTVPEVKRLFDTDGWIGTDWADTDSAAACVERFYDHVSNGRMDFDIVGSVDMDLWPDNDTLKGSAFAERSQVTPHEAQDLVDRQEISQMIEHKVIVDGRSVCDWIASGDVDELWMYNGGGFGYRETRLVGPGGYPYNSQPVPDVDCGGRTFRIVGPSGSRDVEQFIHNFMHGSDDGLRSAYGVAAGIGVTPVWEALDSDSAVRMFLRNRKEVYQEAPERPVSGCGSAHLPPINPTEPDGANPWTFENQYGPGPDLVAWSYPSVCNQMATLSERGPMTPALAQEIRDAAVTVTCETWNCNELGFYEWWHENFSDGRGCQQVVAGNPNGMSHDWWRYFADPVAAREPCSLSGDGGGGPVVTPVPDPPGEVPVAARGPEIMHVVTCLAGRGRVDTNIVNITGRGADYRIEFAGLTARARNVAAADWWRQPITGRADGDHQIVVKREGRVVSDSTVTVRCGAGSQRVDEPEVQVVNACRAGTGYLLFQFANATDETRGWVIVFEGVNNRSTSAAPFGGSVRAVTGRPDGTYDVAIKTAGVVTHELQVAVTCA